MVDVVMKLLAAEVAVTTATNLGQAGLFRIHAPTLAVVTIRNAATVVLGTMTMPAGAIEILVKSPTDTIEATAAVRCTHIAYR